MGRLTALKVKNANAGRHGDGDGLYLLVKPSGARSWLLRIQRDGKRHDIGLGSADTDARTADEQTMAETVPILSRRLLTLAEAREKATALRRFAKAGQDPIVERDKERRKVPTFREAAQATHEALKAGWVDKNAAAFLTTLETHAYPSLGHIRVDQIEASHIRDMLAAIWTTIPETARKVRMRVGQVLNFSHSKGWRSTEAPGRSVSVGLPKRATGKNFDAMPYGDVRDLIADLRAKPQTAGRQALQFLILTAARSGEVRSARWKHIDLAKSDWNRPAELMKNRVAHTVTLSPAALDLLKQVAGNEEHKPGDLIFAAPRGGALSDMTLTKVLRDANETCTVHGFRSSFRDWAAEKMPDVPEAVAEAALAHIVPDKVIRAYKRTKFIEMRRHLLLAWAAFCMEPEGEAGGQ